MFQVERHDESLALVIDPTIVYSTNLGGSTRDYAEGVAVDATGSAIVAGYTASADFPVVNPLQAVKGLGDDAFVAKFTPDGGALEFSTFLGGNNYDQAHAVALDSSGNIYVGGETNSTDFPTVNAVQPAYAGLNDGFALELDATGGSLVYSTHLGGATFLDLVYGIAVDASGRAYLTGYTGSTDFPVVNAIQPSLAGPYDDFVTRLAPSGNPIEYSTYLGGTNTEGLYPRVAATAQGEAVIVGETASPDFPLVNPIQTTHAPGTDAFVTAIDAAGTSLTFSTYLGGSANDMALGVATDDFSNVCVTGVTASSDFPVRLALQPTLLGASDAFLCKISAGGNLAFSTYLGGSDADRGLAVDFDRTGRAYVVGDTTSYDFPLVSPLLRRFPGQSLFVARLASNGQSLGLGTFVPDYLLARSMNVDALGGVALAGWIGYQSLVPEAPFQPDLLCGQGGFVAKISAPCSGAIAVLPATLPTASYVVPYSQTLGASGGSGPYDFGVTEGDLPPGLSLSRVGVLAGTPLAAASFSFTVTAFDAGQECGSQAYSMTVAGGAPTEDVIAGEGLGAPNANRIVVVRADGTPTATDFLAYAAGGWGVNVSAGNLDAATWDEIVSGPGPGPVFGPQVRGFRRDGTSMNVNYYAYGTLRYGVNVASGSVDTTSNAEIVTGPGPGAVFGPHVRGWSYATGAIRPVSRVSFYAYGTLKYGVEAGAGDIDGDGYEELLTGPGPGPYFSSQVRGFDYDGSTIRAIAAVNFEAFPNKRFGANVSAGDVDGDAKDEILTSPGPGGASEYRPRLRAFDFDGVPAVPVPRCDTTPSLDA
ncbi:MAG: SBBP repeat-containing protein [Acidobacteriota bacterium]